MPLDKLLVIAAGLLAPAAWAVPEAALPQTAAAPDLVQLALSLVLVVGLIVGGAWLVKRLQVLGPRNSGSLRIVASLALGPKERLLLVQAGERRLLLGVSAQGIVTLDADAGTTAAASRAPQESFSRQLDYETHRWAAGS